MRGCNQVKAVSKPAGSERGQSCCRPRAPSKATWLRLRPPLSTGYVPEQPKERKREANSCWRSSRQPASPSSTAAVPRLASCPCREVQDLAPTSPDVRPFASENGSHIVVRSEAGCKRLTHMLGAQPHVRSWRFERCGYARPGPSPHPPEAAFPAAGLARGSSRLARRVLGRDVGHEKATSSFCLQGRPCIETASTAHPGYLLRSGRSSTPAASRRE